MNELGERVELTLHFSAAYSLKRCQLNSNIHILISIYSWCQVCKAWWMSGSRESYSNPEGQAIDLL